jgi:hypothetical protein
MPLLRVICWTIIFLTRVCYIYFPLVCFHNFGCKTTLISGILFRKFRTIYRGSPQVVRNFYTIKTFPDRIPVFDEQIPPPKPKWRVLDHFSASSLDLFRRMLKEEIWAAVSNSSTLKKQHSRNQRVTFDFEARFAEFPSIRMKHDKWQNSHGHSGNQLDKFRGPDSREAPPWLAQSGIILCL